MQLKNLFKVFVSVTTLLVLFLISCGSGPATGKLVTEVSPMDGGTVSRDIIQEAYPAGTNVTLTAMPAVGYKFREWAGAVSGNNETITISTVGDMKVIAVFEKLPTLTDSRDGKTYRIVQMPDGKTWMAENLNFATSSGSWCYLDDPSNCNTYGRLYDWNTARNVCPAGWRLPSDVDWTTLVDVIGGRAGRAGVGRRLKSTSGWRNNRFGSDEFGFSALPGGNRLADGSFGAVNSGLWWSDTEYDVTRAWRLIIIDDIRIDWTYKTDGISVRCVRND